MPFSQLSISLKLGIESIGLQKWHRFRLPICPLQFLIFFENEVAVNRRIANSILSESPLAAAGR
jgi:hypothetical protein